MLSSLETTPPATPTYSFEVRGSVQLYTHPTRGGFNDVIAQALRVAGQGTAVLVVQFLKGGIHQGPEAVMHMGSHLEWVRCGLARCIDSPHLESEERQALMDLWTFTQKAVASGRYGLAVLDELSLAIKFGLIPESEVVALLQQRPTAMDVVITGPDMTPALLAAADVVTHQLIKTGA